jgi:hypothetical protein
MSVVALPARGLVAVVGTSYRQDAVREVAAHAQGSGPFLAEVGGPARRAAEDQFDGRWFRAELEREPDNVHDPNAIAVYAQGGPQVGYLGRDNAIAYGPVFARLVGRGSCPAFVVGEERQGQTLGVMLCLSPPEEILA